ncbi:glycosyltransferase family 2 protein [uncultured Thomasclavelia sp.]|uniref:glycosyltransferase family 2 protein n=1 Tax=uncultured Thomasclavelia sp. TaxID=3025759 RepID=UPI002631FDDF|nr:glycosyltransferase family 2 protein [uncultured Thomasclavelia sp.]
MFFSIIVPVYNVEKYLRECVDSILKQNFYDFELILVDDGSKDKSPQICDEYARNDNRVTVLHQKNLGQSIARNNGVKISKGEYIIFLDSDDFIEKDNFLQDIHDKAKMGVDIIIYKFRKYYDEKHEFGRCTYCLPKLDKALSYGQKIAELVKYDAFYCSPWSKAIRGDIIRKNNICFIEGIIAEDQDWYYNVLLNAHSIDGIDESYIAYRQRSNSVSSSWTMKNLQDCLFILEKWNAILSKESINEFLRNAMLSSLAKLYCNLLIAYTNFRDREKKQYKERLNALIILLKYDANPRVKSFKKIDNVCGFKGLLFCLKIICKLR